jgi:putative resolvase
MLTSREAAKLLNVHPNTLRSWAATGQIQYRLTPGGHRRYIVGQQPEKKEETTRTRENIAYCRVSSSKQKADLGRQIEFMQEKYPGYTVIKDVGSGLNYQRKGFKRLLGRIMRYEVGTLAIAERDRLCRFGFDLCAFICETFGTSIVVASSTGEAKPSEDMVQDIMSIIHVFSAKMCGKRRYSRAKITDLQAGRKRKKLGPADTGAEGKMPGNPGVERDVCEEQGRQDPGVTQGNNQAAASQDLDGRGKGCAGDHSEPNTPLSGDSDDCRPTQDEELDLGDASNHESNAVVHCSV